MLTLVRQGEICRARPSTIHYLRHSRKFEAKPDATYAHVTVCVFGWIAISFHEIDVMGSEVRVRVIVKARAMTSRVIVCHPASEV